LNTGPIFRYKENSEAGGIPRREYPGYDPIKSHRPAGLAASFFSNGGGNRGNLSTTAKRQTAANSGISIARDKKKKGKKKTR